jgi:starvation-inducible DNA-binding protein
MEQLIQTMKECLGTVMVLYFKTHGFHWNVEGAIFPAYHKFFEEQYEKMWESVDGFAEQIRQLDAYSPSSLGRMIELSKINEQPKVPEPVEMIEELFQDHCTLITMLTEAFTIATQENKQGLANFLADKIEDHTKMRWMLRATGKDGKAYPLMVDA